MKQSNIVKIKVKVVFPTEELPRFQAGTIIEKALKDAGCKITKFRTTYVECEYGQAEMPAKLMLAMAWNDQEHGGLNWKVSQLGGMFTFNFQ